MRNVPLTLFPNERPALLVVSHERSGTHFLMNALAACYGYVSAPWIDLDHHIFNINYYHSIRIRNTLLALAGRPVANIVKSHHQSDFFTEELAAITPRYVIFYICRNPVSVMRSCWRHLHGLPWAEGPKVADALTFARAEPCGQMMRYQMRQHPDMLRRWAAHIDGWLTIAQEEPRVVPVRYEDLDDRYEETMRSLASALGQPPQSLARPARDVNVIRREPLNPAALVELADLEPLRELCRSVVGPTMARLGY
jgi:hypothetical protein